MRVNKKFLILLLILLLTYKTHAEMYYMSEVIVGEKAAGMGGAFSAVADGPEACFYNPAGLVISNVPYLSISAQVMEYKELKGKFLLLNDERFFSQEFVPSYWGISKDFAGGRAGFSIVVPYYTSYELHERYDNQKIAGMNNATIILDKKSMDKTYLLGPSYARKINSNLFIGSTVYFHSKSLKEQNNSYINVNDSNYKFFQESIEESNATGNGISGNLGLLYSYSEKLNLAFVVKSGDFAKNKINTKGVSFQYTKYKINDSTSFKTSSPLDENIENDFKMPPSTTLGISYKIKSVFLLSYDLTYYFPIAYDISAFYKLPQGNEYFYIKEDRRIRKNSMINHNIGGEYMVTESVPFRFGFYTNYTLVGDYLVARDFYVSPTDVETQRKLRSNPPNRIDNYGITLSSGIISENSTLMFILKYGFGKGDAMGVNLDTNKTEIRDLKYTNYSLGFSGSYWF